MPPPTFGWFSVDVTAYGDETIIDHFNYSPVGTEGKTSYVNGMAWAAPSIGQTQLIIVGGQPVASERTGAPDSRVIAHTNTSNGNYAVYYSDLSPEYHVSTTETSQWLEWVPIIDQEGDDHGYFVQRGYNLDFKTSLSGSEAARISGGLHFSWRNTGSGDGISFANDTLMTPTGGGQYEYQNESQCRRQGSQGSRIRRGR